MSGTPGVVDRVAKALCHGIVWDLLAERHRDEYRAKARAILWPAAEPPFTTCCGHPEEAHTPWCGEIVGDAGGVMPEPRYCDCITPESVERYVRSRVDALSRQAPDGAVTVSVEDVARRLSPFVWESMTPGLDEQYRDTARRLLGVEDRAGDGDDEGG